MLNKEKRSVKEYIKRRIKKSYKKKCIKNCIKKRKNIAYKKIQTEKKIIKNIQKKDI